MFGPSSSGDYLRPGSYVSDGACISPALGVEVCMEMGMRACRSKSQCFGRGGECSL